MPLNLNLNNTKNETIAKLANFKKRQASSFEVELNDMVRKAVLFVAAHYPNNTIQQSREAAMFWIRAIKEALIRGDLLWTFNADGNLNSLFMVRSVNMDKFSVFDVFDVVDNGTLLMIDVGIVIDQSARSYVIETLEKHKQGCTHFAWIRNGDHNTLAVVERKHFGHIARLSTILNFKQNTTQLLKE